MRSIIIFCLLIVKAKVCLAQMNLATTRHFEFQNIFDSRIKTKFDSVFIYDFKFNKKGVAKDSVLVSKNPLNPSAIQEADNYVYTFDSLKRESQRFEIKEGKKILNAEKQYNSQGELSIWIWYTREGKINSKTFYEYDEQGNLTQTNRYYGYWYLDKPKLEDRIEYVFSKNKLIEKREYIDQKSDTVWLEVRTTKYDSLGRQIYFKDKVGGYYWFLSSTFDSKGRLTKEIIEGNRTEKSIKEFLYKENALPYQLIWYYPDKMKKRPIQLTKYYFK